MRYALVALIALSGCAYMPDIHDPYVQGTIAAGVADVATTYVALDRNAGDEANPLMALCGDSENRAARTAACGAVMKTGIIFLISGLEQKYNIQGWYKRVLWLMPIVLWGGAAIWNATVIW